MFIAIVDFEVLAENRQLALEILVKDQKLARQMSGNLSYRAFSNADSETHIGLFHEWSTQSDFDAYCASKLFASIGAALRPMMTSAPSSRRMTAELVEERRA